MLRLHAPCDPAFEGSCKARRAAVPCVGASHNVGDADARARHPRRQIDTQLRLFTVPCSSCNGSGTHTPRSGKAKRRWAVSVCLACYGLGEVRCSSTRLGPPPPDVGAAGAGGGGGR